MVIKILGTGCPNCKQTKAIAQKAVQDLNMNAEVVDVTDIPTIMSYGVMTTPAIVIDEKVVGYGGVPTYQQMVSILQQQA